MKRRKFKKSWWLPWTLALYAAAMSVYFGPRLIQEGYQTKFWISVGVEATVILLLFFALRHKEKLQERREAKEVLDLKR